jgi:hypothetical protein
VPRHQCADIFGTIFRALVADIAERSALVAVQQEMRLSHLGEPMTVCIRPDAASTQTCAFVAECQSFPFFDWCIS